MTAQKPDEQQWERLGSRVLLKHRFNVIEDHLRTPVGKEMDYIWLQGPDAAVVLAFTDEGRVVVTKQYRHPLGRVIFDLPAGGVHTGESPEQAALRELAEETGYKAHTIQLLGRFYPIPGASPHAVHVFLARALEAGQPALDEHELVDVVLMDWDNLLDMVLAGDAVDVALAYAVLLYAVRQHKEERLQS